MKGDPLVEEGRRAGQEYIASFKGDWVALVADLNRRTKESGRKVVTRPPRKPFERRDNRTG